MNLYSKIISLLGCLPVVFGIVLYIIYYRAVNALGRLPNIHYDKVADLISKPYLFLADRLFKITIAAIIISFLVIILNSVFFKTKISKFAVLVTVIGVTFIILIKFIDPFGAFVWVMDV